MVESDSKGSTARRIRLAIAGALLVALSVALLRTPDASSLAPRVDWRIDGHDDVAAIVETEAATRFSLELTLPFDAHAYVASFDPLRGTIAHFPSQWLRSNLAQNPLPRGTHRLPGRNDGVELRWHSGHVGGAVSIVVLVSREPLDALETLLAKCRQMGNAAFPKRPVLGAYAPEAGMDAVPARAEVHGELLRAAVGWTEESSVGPMAELPGHPGVFVKVLRFDNAMPQAQATRDQVRDAFAPLTPSVPGGDPTRPPR